MGRPRRMGIAWPTTDGAGDQGPLASRRRDLGCPGDGGGGMRWRSKTGLSPLRRRWRSKRPSGPNGVYIFVCSFSLFFSFCSLFSGGMGGRRSGGPALAAGFCLCTDGCWTGTGVGRIRRSSPLPWPFELHAAGIRITDYKQKPPPTRACTTLSPPPRPVPPVEVPPPCAVWRRLRPLILLRIVGSGAAVWCQWCHP